MRIDLRDLSLTPAQIREALTLEPHPEGGHYREIWRDTPRHYQTNAPGPQEGTSRGRRLEIDAVELAKADPLAKAILDVGTQTNFTQITGGQSLGYVSLDTRLARGTVRPDSFTLYQALAKSPAYQVVDYFAYIDDLGGALPGSATSGTSNVQSGTLATNAGIYTLQSINLKLMLDGRAVTLALMAQNNFVSVNEQENANAALTVLQTADWMCFHGNPNVFPNQFAGIAALEGLLAQSVPLADLTEPDAAQAVDGPEDDDEPDDAPEGDADEVPDGIEALTADGKPRCWARKGDGSQCANGSVDGSHACGLAAHQKLVK